MMWLNLFSILIIVVIAIAAYFKKDGGFDKYVFDEVMKRLDNLLAGEILDKYREAYPERFKEITKNLGDSMISTDTETFTPSKEGEALLKKLKDKIEVS